MTGEYPSIVHCRLDQTPCGNIFHSPFLPGHLLARLTSFSTNIRSGYHSVLTKTYIRQIDNMQYAPGQYAISKKKLTCRNGPTCLKWHGWTSAGPAFGIETLNSEKYSFFFDFCVLTVQIKVISHSRERRFILHHHMNITREKTKPITKKEKKRKCKKSRR